VSQEESWGVVIGGSGKVFGKEERVDVVKGGRRGGRCRRKFKERVRRRKAKK